MCKDCGCTIFGNICLRCEQNAALESSLKRDSGLDLEKDLTGTKKPYSSCTITSSIHDESLNFGESIKKDSRDSSKTDTDEHILSNDISRRIAKFSTFYGRIDPEGKESDISYGDEEVSSFFERESEKRHDTAVVDCDIHSPALVDLPAEKVFLQDIVLKQENEERNSKMLILHRHKFWPVFFRNKVDFGKDKVTKICRRGSHRQWWSIQRVPSVSHEIFSRITDEHALWECSEKSHVNIGTSS